MCDICTEMPTPTDDGKTYTFKILPGLKFHDGSALTSKDVLATFQRIIFPKEGISSAREAEFNMVESVTAPDESTIVFKLKYPAGAFIPSLASPFNWIYSKAKLDADPRWYEKNVMGSGPFVFGVREAGARITGTRNPNYHHKGQPYLDGFEAIFAKTQTLRVQAIRGDQAAIEFRGFPPKSRDDLVAALGKDITVQESDWNCVLIFTPNHERKPFDDVRVRRALSLAVDRWGGAPSLSKIAIVKTVGGIVFPGHPLAAKKEELTPLTGYWPRHREVARRSQAAAQGGGPRAPEVHAREPRSRSALHDCRHLADRPVEEDRDRGHAEGRSDWAVLRTASLGQLRRGPRVQLQVGREPARRRLEVPRLGRRPVRPLQGPRA